MQIISGLNSFTLASKLSKNLNMPLVETVTKHFSDGELKIQVKNKIDREVVIVQSTSAPVNDNFMELLLLADTAIRAGAQNITAIIPYLGYSRQDRCTYKYGPISASVVIKMIEAIGINRVITLDLHSAQLEGIFGIPIMNLSTERLFIEKIMRMGDDIQNSIIISPDIGGIARARRYSSLLKKDLAIINKTRDDDVCSMSEVIGDVKGKRCIIVDDIVDSAGTLCMATDLLMQNGARSVNAIITHAVLSGAAVEKIKNSSLERIYVTDSIYHTNLADKFKVISASSLIADELRCE